MPSPLRDGYQDALENAILSTRDSRALVHARIGELLGEVDGNQAGIAWDDLKKAYTSLRRAMSAGDAVKVEKSLRSLDAAIARGADSRVAWEEIGTNVDREQRLIDSEFKRLVAEKEMMGADSLRALVSFLMLSLKESVETHSDKKTGNKILTDFSDAIRRSALDASRKHDRSAIT